MSATMIYIHMYFPQDLNEFLYNPEEIFINTPTPFIGA